MTALEPRERELEIRLAKRRTVAKHTFANGINASGHIVGMYDDGTGADFGFVYANGIYRPLKLGVGGVGGTAAFAINASGHVVGEYVETRPTPYKQRAFLYTNGLFATFAYPAANVFATSAWGINAAGHIVGNYSSTLPGVGGPFLYINGLWAPIGGYPSAMETHAFGINDNGQIVGQWRDSPGQYDHGYLLKDGTYTSIDFPNSTYTSAFGINNSGHIVGHYIDKNTHQTHGYSLKNGVYTSFDFPTGVGSTEPRAINDNGQIVGNYYKDGRHGFLYDPIGNTFTTIDAP